MSGIACVEMACWDIIGKETDKPVYELLGGRVQASCLSEVQPEDARVLAPALGDPRGAVGPLGEPCVDEAVEVGRRHGPGVALVLDELVHARDRGPVAVVDELDGADQRRRVALPPDAARVRG